VFERTTPFEYALDLLPPEIVEKLWKRMELTGVMEEVND
jgi:hypothetical protein